MKENKVVRRLACVIFVSIGLVCLAPFILLVSVSISDNARILNEGYNILPVGLDLSAFTYIWQRADSLIRAVGISAFITIVGTFCGIMVSLMFAYSMARKGFPLRRFMALFILIPMLFNGGLVPQYIMYTQVFPVKNTLLALLIPNLLMNSYNVIVMRTFIMSSVPNEILEAAEIDGASELRLFTSLGLPLSLPIIGTTGLMTGMAYYNDWTNGLYYITDAKYFSLQNLLNQMLTNIQFLQTSGNQLANLQGQALTELPSGNIRMALAVVGLIPVLLAFPFIHRAMSGGLTVGALKG